MTLFGLLKKIQLRKSEDLSGFIKPVMNGAASHLASSDTQSCSKWKVFIERIGKKLLAKGKIGSGQDILFLWGNGFLSRSLLY